MFQHHSLVQRKEKLDHGDTSENTHNHKLSYETFFFITRLKMLKMTETVSMLSVEMRV